MGRTSAARVRQVVAGRRGRLVDEEARILACVDLSESTASPSVPVLASVPVAPSAPLPSTVPVALASLAPKRSVSDAPLHAAESAARAAAPDVETTNTRRFRGIPHGGEP